MTADGSGWHQLSLTIPADAVERASDLLLELGASGLNEDYPELHDAGPALSGDPGEWTPPPPAPGSGTVELSGYLPADVDPAAALHALRQKLAQIPELTRCPVALERVPDEDWGRAWREHYKAVDVGRWLRIRPSWEPAGDDRRQEILIDPGMAFGTGTHFTTAACLELMEEVLEHGPPRSVLDVGTGTGVLAIAAAHLGATPIYAFDSDASAVDVARVNLEHNGVTDRIELWCGTVDRLRRRHDLVLANLLAPLLCQLAGHLARVMTRRGQLIASGLLVDQEEEVRDALAGARLSVVERRTDGEWVAMLLERA